MSEEDLTPLEDALSLLEYEDYTWVSFKRHVFLPYDGVSTKAHGVWNYVFDVYIFWVEAEGPNMLIISEGSMAEADWSTYRFEEELNRLFNKRYRECKTVEDKIVHMDRGLP